MKKYVVLLIYLCISINSFSQNFPYKLNRAHKDATNSQNPCEFGVNVKDNRPNNCVFDNNFYMYPVFIEEFNYKEELPNNWRFDMGYTSTDDVGSGYNGLTFLGDAYKDNNVYTENGYGYLEWRKEQKLNKYPKYDATTTQDFDFTGSFLNSLFQLRQGVFEARIKLPENPNYWPAYWLINNQEIDIFEFFDGDVTSQNTCDTYHQMKMNIHGYIDGDLNINYATEGLTHCNRNRKFPVPDDFFDNYHTYKCVWTDYKIDIYLDGTRVGSASKYYDGPFFPTDGCEHASVDGWIPSNHRDCNYMSNTQECNVRVKVPNWPDFWNWHYECWVYNQVKKDMTFPTTTIPMNLVINNSIAHLKDNPGALEQLKSSWSSLELKNRRVGIEWVKIYQPVVCSAPRYVCSMGDFKSITGNTNFLSGSVIQMGNGNSCNLHNIESDNFPMHILATEEIQFLGDMMFDSLTYLRAEIIDCNGGFNQYQRTTESGEKLYLTDEEIAELEKKQNDSLMKSDPAFRDSMLAYNEREQLIEVRSEVDNGAITIFPNPTENYLHIGMTEEDYYDLYQIEIFDNMGREYPIEKANAIDVAFLSAGFYQIKFKFSHGFVVVKNFIKK
jgi:hypothetical protein